MLTRLALATLVLSIATLGATPPTTAPLPARPPDGTYSYSISNVPGLTQTVIVIRSNGTTVSTLETVNIGGSTISTQTDYDQATLLPTHYRATVRGTVQQAAISNGTAAVVGSTLAASKLPGTVGPLISDGLFSVMAMLPSIVSAVGGQPLTDVTQRFTVVQMTSVLVSDPRPTGVPQNDVETALDYGGQRETFWSNPVTHIVDRTDIGKAFITLVSYSTATSVVTPTPAPTALPTAQPQFRSTDVWFASSGGAVIAGTLTVPDAATPHRMPAFIFIHGSGPGTRDAAIPQNPTFLDLSNALSNNGVVVLRYDKRGIGKSTGAGTEDWHPLGDDARAAIAFLKHQPAVDPNRIFILGHSEGGEIAPLIAPSIRGLAGIVLMAGPAIPLNQIIGKQLPGKANAPYRARLLKGFAAYSGLDPAVYIAKVNVPILVLQGGRDIQVLASDLPHLVNAARAAHRDITVKLLPQDDHLFLRLAPATPSNGTEYFIPAPLDPRVPQAILAWLHSLPTSGR